MTGFAFPRSARLLRPAQFTEVFKRPTLNLSSGPLRIRVRKNRMHTARLGIVVPKRGTAHAHRRNRVKRLVRQEFRMLRDELPPVDIVIQVFGAVDDHGFQRQLRQQLSSIAERLDKLELSKQNS